MKFMVESGSQKKGNAGPSELAGELDALAKRLEGDGPVEEKTRAFDGLNRKDESLAERLVSLLDFKRLARSLINEDPVRVSVFIQRLLIAGREHRKGLVGAFRELDPPGELKELLDTIAARW